MDDQDYGGREAPAVYGEPDVMRLGWPWHRLEERPYFPVAPRGNLFDPRR